MITFGGLAALSSAFCYALASVFFRRLGKEVQPIGVTILKSVIACLFTGLALVLIGDVDAFLGRVFELPLEAQAFQWNTLSQRDFWLLFASGFLGITIGDTAYFHTLNALGTRKTLILDTLSPSVTVLFAGLILGESLILLQFFGIVLTIIGVGVVMFARASTQKASTIDPPLNRTGLVWAAISVLSHAFAYITAKGALDAVPSMEASMLRQGTAMLTLVLFCVLQRKLKSMLLPAFRPHNIRMLLGASTCGSFFGIWLGLLGIKLAPVSIASTLNTTSPLFILPINKIFEGQGVSLRAAIGAIIAVIGAAILLVGP